MTVYEPKSRSELGKNAINPRVHALRAMNGANGPQYRRYDRSGKAPVYQVTTLAGEVRNLATTEVPAYIIGQVDGYAAFREQVQIALDKALQDPDVSDRTSLVARVLSGLDEQCGDHLTEAADFFLNPADTPKQVAAA